MTYAVIYALGGGSGHLMRALNLARSFSSAIILHQAIDAPPIPTRAELIRVGDRWRTGDVVDLLRALAKRASTLVVDTFPGGIAHELDDAVLDTYPHRILVRRYLRPGSYDDETALAARFDRTLLPYWREHCEWEGRIAGDYVGPLVRELASQGAAHDLVVIGALPTSWLPLLSHARFVRGPITVLPRARRYLAAAAGHNLTYELLQMGATFALCPQERRYDDQFRRADRLGAGIFHRADLIRWLEAT